VPEAVRFRDAVGTEADHRYFLDEVGAVPLPGGGAADDLVALLVGPEGGWTEPERKMAAEAGWRAASLGPHILRAETAAISAMAVVVTAWLKTASLEREPGEST
jgi:16S rRNA (uracil1498-N3)-methyltransferase